VLCDFIAENREVILARARERVVKRNSPLPTEVELKHGLPVFLEQLRKALRKSSLQEAFDDSEIQTSARKHGDDLFRQGLTIAQIVHDYGDLCQVITSLAVERGASIGASEFQMLNLCLDDAIAGAVTSYAELRNRATTEEGAERLGVLAHELRGVLTAAILSFASIKRGIVAPGGSTGEVHDRQLLHLSVLIDRSLADVRLDAALKRMERIPLWEIVEEVEITASALARSAGVNFVVTPVERTIAVDVDRQILASAIYNLLQNAFKFTGPATTVHLRARAIGNRVLIEVEDECGGLPPGRTENLFQPFVQRGRDRTGLGLGLSICLRAVKALAGDIRSSNIPGRGCIFTIDLPAASDAGPVPTQ
jgi:signal transduction histidine kinase